MTIGIAGYGFVGQAVYSCMEDNDVTIYDPPKGFSCNILDKCEAIFCCLPTLTINDKQDFSKYEEFFAIMGEYPGLLIIKSTVLYKNIKPYLDKFNIVVNPEFLSQNNFQKDFYKQRTIILGGRMDLCKKAEKIYRNHFKFESSNIEFEFCSVKEAIDLKYTHNTYHAYKSLFWNYVNEVCDNHRKISDLYSRITGNTFEMQNIYADGTPGYGGACFPKDVRAMQEERPHELTEFMIKFNERLREGLEES